MSEEKIGTARIDITGDSKGIEAATARASESIREMNRSARAEYRSLSEVERKRVDALMRQGQSLRDALRGTKSASDVLFDALKGLPVPIAAGAGAIAAMGIAAAQGASELKELNTHLIMTGNSAGFTVDQVSTMAARLDDLKGITRGAAAEALTQAISNGKIAKDQIEAVAETALRANQILGREVAVTINEFAKLGDSPTESAAKLNKQHNFLTLELYEQIRALEQQGRAQEAASLAQEALTRVTKERLNEVEQSLGFVERAWNAAGRMASDAWDKFKGLGRESTAREIISSQEKQIESYLSEIANHSRFGAWEGMSSKDVDALRGVDNSTKAGLKETLGALGEARAALAQSMAELAGSEFTADAQGRNAADAQRKIEASESWRKQGEQVRSRQQQREKEIADAKKWAADIGATEEDLAKRISQINEKYKDRKTGGGSGPKNDEATRLLQSYQQQEASLRAQLQVNDKLGTHQKRLVEFEQQIVDLKTKKTLTADERSLLLNEGKLRAQLKINASLEQEQETHQAIVKVQERSAQIIEQMASSRDNTNSQYQRELDAYGMGDKAMQRLQDQRSIYKEFERYQRQLANATDFSKAGAAAQYAEETAKIEAELQRRLLMQQNYYATIDEMQGSWLLGANHGLANYADEAANAFLNTSNLVNKSFKSMEDSLVEFARTGKLSFSDLADSVIRDLMRIMIQQSVMGPLASMFGGLFDGGAGTGNLTGGSLSGATWFGTPAVGGNGLSGLAKLWSGGYTGDGGKYDPAGIVHKGEGVLNADEIRAIGGEAGFNALRQSIRGIGHSMGGMASKPVATPQLMAPKQQPQQPINIYSTIHAAPGTNAAELSAMLDQRDKQLRYQIYEEILRGRVEV
ncbi:phage tail tape measure protein [Paenalcaligenes sp. Me131]|uniref:phage tail tape measure protein n=1 Tax=Paenalcaligenes sp. Me131 TaxID=3392636 RepID=UPI003D2714BA